MSPSPPTNDYVGYSWLIRAYGLKVTQPWVTSRLSSGSKRIIRQHDGVCEETYPKRDDPGPHWTDHLEFALRRETANLEVLAALFAVVDRHEFAAWLATSPTGKYRRVAWFLMEWLTGEVLPIDDLEIGNYVPVLDAGKHFARNESSAPRSRRHRVINNLLGPREYCPMLRRTPTLVKYLALHLEERALRLANEYPPELMARATQYLYLRETRSSFAIENESPDNKRTQRFIALLRIAGRVDCYTRDALVSLQHAIVDPRYAEDDFRTTQNYVGETASPTFQIVHYIPPRPEDVDSLMEGWMITCRSMADSGLHPVLAATVAAFGFVYIHPFGDGNGRLHRYLVHHELARARFTPDGLVFPISATMLKEKHRYLMSLDTYSKRVLEHVEHQQHDDGRLSVLNDTNRLYRYPDLTTQAEALFSFIETTIDKELVAELSYLQQFDEARSRVAAIVDMPDQRLDLFVRLCLQNNGKLAKGKRSLFSELDDEEVAAIEEAAGRNQPPSG